jgi:hypothetical protein
MSNSEIASIIGVDRKTVPTIAKAYRDRHGLPDWKETETAAVADSKKPEQTDIEKLVAARVLIESFKDTEDPTLLTLIGDIARVSSGIVRAKK